MPAEAAPSLTTGEQPWWRTMTRYHWWVLIVAALGWMCDTFDQRIFIMSRQGAIEHLVLSAERTGQPAGPEVAAREKARRAEPAFKADVVSKGRTATACMLVGWAIGGLFFGVIGDKWGRVFTMMLTILIYSIFTALSAFAANFDQFAVCQVLKGIGVGGEFAAGVALVAEVMPAAARPHALGLMQALSAVGNISGSAISGVVVGDSFNLLGRPFEGWQVLFLIGVIPAVLVVLIRSTVQEPASWRAAKEREKQGSKERLGNMGELFSNPTLRRHTIVGVTLAVSGVIGLWGVGFFSPELISEALAGVPAQEQARARAMGTMLQDVGAFFGIYAFTYFTSKVGRRPAFLVSFVAAGATCLLVFGTLKTRSDIYWMMPLLGFTTLSVFGGYAIYFSELYPTRLRTTGTGFCYNVSRVIAAAGIMLMSPIQASISASGAAFPFRVTCMAMSAVFLVGLLALPFAPETRRKTLFAD